MLRLRKYHKKGDHFEIVHTGKFSLARMSSTWAEKACHGAFCFFTHNGGDGGSKQFLNSDHVLTVPGDLVETGAGNGVGIVPPDAKPSQAVKDLFGMGERQ